MQNREWYTWKRGCFGGKKGAAGGDFGVRRRLRQCAFCEKRPPKESSFGGKFTEERMKKAYSPMARKSIGSIGSS